MKGMVKYHMGNDFFAQIAANGIGGIRELLTDPQPKPFDRRDCNLTAGNYVRTESPEKLSTREGLRQALREMRARYAQYLTDHAPACHSTTVRTELKNFTLDGKEEITLPHYGGPIGVGRHVYETTFTLEALPEGKAAYICFKGVDYYATVYVNDRCVGMHEGFFSPFEFEITEAIKPGVNTLRVDVRNDHIYMGNGYIGQKRYEGDKLYAATGLGWDDPVEGWHHCPSGMGIYNDVTVEVRNTIHITDIFVRPMPDTDEAEAWIEVENASYEPVNLVFSLSLYGQNFAQTVFENMEHEPGTILCIGCGDTYTEAVLEGEIATRQLMPAKHGVNVYRVPISIPDCRRWELETPWLYQLQVSVLDGGTVCDSRARQFGMRTFTQDIESTPKGMFYLNGRKTRLRGANTMGFEQQDVMRHDFDQLIDDILLAKICNMNFLRLTQRPVQEEVYTYCDRLGLMTQTDLPLFGCMRRTKFCEGVRQAEEMERLVRSHCCNVVISYLNEPTPNAANEPHRHLARNELKDFFAACDLAVHLNNPDRVIKHIDGDYDPPDDSLPDNHCYPMWYNAHGIDIGRLHKGYWLSVKPGWYYGCGEFGIEGLDFPEVMREFYPADWCEEPFNPNKIGQAQSGNFHYFFYETPDTLEHWSYESQKHQAFAVRMMTEAYRRNADMITQAIHLFIDAWPSGWMKTIMDCRRNPKPAYFAYRNALEPKMISLRTDRFTYYVGEQVSVETWLCNDTYESSNAYSVVYELYHGDEIVMRGTAPAVLRESDVTYVANATFTAPEVEDREKYVLRVVLLDEAGRALTDNTQEIEIFRHVEIPKNDRVELITRLTPGEYTIAGEKVKVKKCGMLPLHFVSRDSGHPMVAGFEKTDFRYFYDAKSDMITPILDCTFTADGFRPILKSGNQNDNGDWVPVLAAAEKEYNGKRYIICQVDLRTENPIAERMLARFYAE